jgi:signal transduction histidine kinase
MVYIFLVPTWSLGQANSFIDSLRARMASPIDTVSINAETELARYYRNVNSDSSIRIAEHVLVRSAKAGYTAGIGHGQTILGISKTRRGEYKAAIAHYKSARAAFEQIGDLRQVGRVVNNSAVTNISMGNYIAAMHLWYQADSIYTLLHDESWKATIHNNMGYALEKMGAYEQALEMQQMSLAYNAKHKVWSTLGLNHLNIGNIYAVLRSDSLALASYDTSIAILNRIQDYYHVAQASQYKGKLLRRMQQYGAARKCLDDALRLWQDGKFKSDVGDLYLEYSALSQSLNKLDEAEQYLAKALALFTEYNNQALLATCHLRQGELALARGNWVGSTAAAEKAVQVAKGINAKPTLLEAYQLLARGYGKQGQYARAYAVFTNLQSLQDSLTRENSAGRLAQMQVSFQLSRKQREIEQLQRAEQDGEVRSQQRVLLFIIGLLVITLLGIVVLVLQRRRFRRINLSQLEAISSASPIGLSILSWNTAKTLYVNERIARYYNFEPKEMVGKTASELGQRVKPLIDIRGEIVKAQGRVRDLEVPGLMQNGDKVWFLMNTDRTIMRGEDVIVLGLLDITHRKQMEQELTRAKEEAETSVAELQSARSQLLLREKLASLGEIVAGIAHEINNPMSAIKAMSETVVTLMPRVLGGVTTMQRELPATLLPAWNELLQQVLGKHPLLSTREERQHRKKMADDLRAAGLPEAEDLAHLFTECGIYEASPAMLQIAGSSYRDNCLELLKELRMVIVSQESTKESAERTSQLLQALKKYTHTSPTTAEQGVVNLRDNIGTIVVLFSYQIRRTADLLIELDPDAYVWGNSDKLSQVWTNLITNAVQAMPAKGTLQIEARVQADRVHVQISDTGYGIPADVLPHIFDPFFTTKPKGVGTGMGLPISKKIVDEMGGSITVTSRPGHTVFEVSLPLYRQNGLSHATESTRAA